LKIIKYELIFASNKNKKVYNMKKNKIYEPTFSLFWIGADVFTFCYIKYLIVCGDKRNDVLLDW